MRTVLITGAGPTGVTGRAIKEYLQDSYIILSPSSKELDLTNDEAVSAYFDSHQIDFVVHCATYRSNTSQTTHLVDDEFESNLRMYFNLSAQSLKFRKMIYLGSGAEYDKSRPIVNITEDQFGERIPKDKYGFGKYIMNHHCRSSKNIYNLRMFGTFNKYERYTKNVVCNLCAKAVMGLPLTLKQDVRFSWVDIQDVTKVINFIFECDVRRHDYNIALPKSYRLLEIAELIQNFGAKDKAIMYEKEGLNLEYTCNTNSLFCDFPIVSTNLEDSLRTIFNYYASDVKNIEVDKLDGRWK